MAAAEPVLGIYGGGRWGIHLHVETFDTKIR